MASRMLPMVQLYTFLVRTLADGDILVTTSSSDGSYVIETICTQCSCPTAIFGKLRSNLRTRRILDQARQWPKIQWQPR